MDSLPSYAKKLNDMQLKAVFHGTNGGTRNPLLILAGAGSGKTKVITVKIAHLIAEKMVKPQDILAVTFTNKAAEEMRSRAASLAPGAGDALIRTFHSFGAWLLRRNAPAAGLDRGFVIYDEEDSVSLLKSAMEGTIEKSGAAAKLKRLVFQISRAKDYALTPEDDLTSINPDPDFKKVYALYEERLKYTGNVDFGDLILKPLKMLAKDDAIRERIRQRFSVVLVDEFQDSNAAQYELLKQLTGPDTYLCVVGDDDQSIYRFRGAEVKNILAFPEQFPGTDIIRLEENYRSTPNILSLASEVVSNNERRLGKTLWTSRENGPIPVLAYLRDHREEAELCAEIISGGKVAGGKVAGGGKIGGTGRLSDTAILYRVNAQSREFEHCFSRKKIPYRIVGSVSFYSREEVKDALAVLSLLVNPKDEVAFGRIINKPARGLGPGTVKKMVSRREEAGGSFVRALELAAPSFSGNAKSGASVFLTAYKKCKAFLEEEPVSKVAEEAITAFGLKPHYLEEDAAAGTSRVSNLEEVVSAAADYGKGLNGLLQFLEDLELDRSRIEGQGEGAEDEDRVTLITMHNTKGLEFGRVIITGLEEGIFPSLRGGQEDTEDIEEERRLFYVAITRAREELYLTTCGLRQIWGKTMPSVPSRFLSDFSKELVREKYTYARDAVSGGYGGFGFPAQRGPAGAHTGGTFALGMEVSHPEYGKGVIAGIRKSGGQEIVSVVFDDDRLCQFIPKYANLKPLRSGD